MLRISMACAVFAFSIALAAPASAGECSASAGPETIRLLREAKTCKQSLKIMQLCGATTSLDVQYAEIVIEKCERDFTGQASKARLAAYRSGMERCASRYAGKSGTMYVSFAAHCQAALAARFSGK